MSPDAPTITRPRWRARLVRVAFVTVLVVQAGLLARGYRDPHSYFAFQPFSESSTWRAEIVRVTVAGERVPVEDEWPGGYDWDELVGWGVLAHPDRLRHAYARLDASLDYLDDALDWVADHTPDDTETRYLEATTEGYRNTRGPEIRVLRSHDRDVGR